MNEPKATQVRADATGRESENVNELDAAVKKFFDDYERANADFDVERIAALYAGVFMFGDPRGTQSVKKEDFVRVLPRRKEFFKSVGLASSKLASLEVSQLDSKYVLVRTVWTMRFERSAREAVDSQNSATYVLSVVGDSYQIVLQIDHQDLTKKVQELGLE